MKWFPFFCLLLLTSNVFLAQDFLQSKRESFDLEGPVKKVQHWDYAYQTWQKTDSNGLLLPFQICDFYQVFDYNGYLQEDNEYVILEPVDELYDGYCQNRMYMHENGILTHIQASASKVHGLGDEQDIHGLPIFERIVEGDTTYIHRDALYWGGKSTQLYINGELYRGEGPASPVQTFDPKSGLLIHEKSWEYARWDTVYTTYEYDSEDRCTIKITEKKSFDEFGLETGYTYTTKSEYSYYDNDSVFCEKSYSKVYDNDFSLSNEEFFSKNGLDSVYVWHNRSKNRTDTTRHFYTFFANGDLKSKKSFRNGLPYGTKLYDSLGRLIHVEYYSIKGNMYESESKTFNKDGKLTRLDYYRNKKNHYWIRAWDKYGNWIEQKTYNEAGELIERTSRKIEYYLL